MNDIYKDTNIKIINKETTKFIQSYKRIIKNEKNNKKKKQRLQT